MNTVTSQAPLRRSAEPDPSVSGIPFSRLVRAELRKLVDTRAGFWLLVAIAVAASAVIALMLFFADAAELSFLNFMAATGTPLGVLLPVLGILAVTTEWSQRTGLVTFTLEPRRSRIVAAKLLAGLILSAMFFVLATVVAAAASLLAEAAFDGPGSWDSAGLIVANIGLLVAISVLQGIGFGMLIMNTPAAIVLLFVLPTIWNVLGFTVSWLEEPAEWLDLNRTSIPLTTGSSLSGEQWAQLAVSCGVWVALPLALGIVRLLRREVK
ncbi:MAG: ABC transporter permease [Actinomycetota bacterium]|nr:ABC transporter permease [Actinomycetota bacterium]